MRLEATQLLKSEYIEYAKNAFHYKTKQMQAERTSSPSEMEASVEIETEHVDGALQFDSDLEDNDEMSFTPDIDDAINMPTDEEFGDEFDECLKRYKVACKRLPWKLMYPDKWKKDQNGQTMSPPQFPIDFWDVDMKPVFEKLNQENQGDEAPFGYLPVMAIASKGSIGALLASSFWRVPAINATYPVPHLKM